MDKPKPIVREPVLDYHDVIHYIEEKYNIETRDYGRRSEYHNKCVEEATALVGGDKSWYTTIPAQFTDEQRKAHDKYEELQKSKPPYLDYWHYLLDHDFCDIINGCDRYLNLKGLLEYKDTPEWVKEITQLIWNEFSEYTDGEGFEVHISW